MFTAVSAVMIVSLLLPQVHCGDPSVEARLEAKINEACTFFEKKPQEMAQVGVSVSTKPSFSVQLSWGYSSEQKARWG